MLRCCTSHEVLFFISAALTNGKHKIIKQSHVVFSIHCVSYLLSNHPVTLTPLGLAVDLGFGLWTSCLAPLNKHEVSVVAILFVLDA